MRGREVAAWSAPYLNSKGGDEARLNRRACASQSRYTCSCQWAAEKDYTGDFRDSDRTYTLKPFGL